ncbi:MAG: DUF4339 domain-containing protein [Verrucomicrobiota bacterium]
MAGEWIVRVEGQEYGPVDPDTLREWQREGRLLPENPVRKNGDHAWINASQIPDIFPIAEMPVATVPSRTLYQILAEAGRLYARGFFPFLVLTLLPSLPSFCAQLSAPVTGMSSNVPADLQSALAGGFSFLMLLLSVAAWPVFIAGIQIATADLMADRVVRIFDLLRRAILFWPRVAGLCLFVYGNFFFWTLLPVAVVIVVAMSGPSIASLFIALVVLAFQVWITARLFRNFLFWQQFAVLAGADMGQSLRQSKELARTACERPWYQRPLWRGAVLASLWCAVVMLLNLGPEWQMVQLYLQQLSTAPDPQAIIQSLANAKPHGLNLADLSLSLVQIALRPLLGISFVVLYFDAKKENPPIAVD